MAFNYFIPTRILFGNGTLDQLASQPLPGKKALLVISSGRSMKRLGYLERVEALLDKAGVPHILFDKILPNPTLAHVTEGAALARAEGCDFVVGLGGGSSIDSAKAIAVAARNPGSYWDYIPSGTGGRKPIPNDPLPIVAITTTAGTGTEADPWAVISNTETGEKIGFGYDKTYPVLSIVDPQLMMSVPPMLTAFQGFDALFHSTEGYINRIPNEAGELFALESIRLAARWLPDAVKDGQNALAREKVALSNTLAGLVQCLSNSTSAHAMEHALSAFHPNLPHGAGLIMIAEAYYGHLIQVHACDERFVQMARAMGMENASQPADFLLVLRRLMADCGVDSLRLSDYGVDGNDLEKYAQRAFDTQPNMFKADPVDLSFGDVVEILRRSFR